MAEASHLRLVETQPQSVPAEVQNLWNELKLMVAGIKPGGGINPYMLEIQYHQERYVMYRGTGGPNGSCAQAIEHLQRKMHNARHPEGMFIRLFWTSNSEAQIIG